jgi:long-subunit fatty acid transport protein
MQAKLSSFFSLFVVCAYLSIPCAADILELKQGTMMLGGEFSLPFEYNYKDEIQFKIDFKPAFDYFVLDNFSVGGSLKLAYTAVDAAADERGPVVWGFHAGFKYYPRFANNLYGFTGFQLFLEQNDLDLVSSRFGFEVPLGLMWALNERVALIFSIPVKVQCKSTVFFDKVVVAPGYFGVAAFF